MAQIVKIQIDPVSAPRMTQRDKWTDVAKGKGRPGVLRYFIYKNALNKALPGFQLPQILAIDFYIAMPKSYSQKKRTALVGSYHNQKPDIDNLAKSFMDSFKNTDGKHDDKHVADLHVRKYWADVGSILILVGES